MYKILRPCDSEMPATKTDSSSVVTTDEHQHNGHKLPATEPRRQRTNRENSTGTPGRGATVPDFATYEAQEIHHILNGDAQFTDSGITRDSRIIPSSYLIEKFTDATLEEFTDGASRHTPADQYTQENRKDLHGAAADAVDRRANRLQRTLNLKLNVDYQTDSALEEAAAKHMDGNGPVKITERTVGRYLHETRHDFGKVGITPYRNGLGTELSDAAADMALESGGDTLDWYATAEEANRENDE